MTTEGPLERLRKGTTGPVYDDICTVLEDVNTRLYILETEEKAEEPPLKKGWCAWFMGHKWTKWTEPDNWINPNQNRYCVKCGRYQRKWVPS